MSSVAMLAGFNDPYSASAMALPPRLSSTALLRAMRNANMACSSSVLCMPLRTNQVASQVLAGPQLRCAWRVRLAMGVASILSGIASGSSVPYSASAVVLSACLPGRSFLLRELHAKPSHQGLGPSLMLASTCSASHETDSLASAMLGKRVKHHVLPFKPNESGLPSQNTYPG